MVNPAKSALRTGASTLAPGTVSMAAMNNPSQLSQIAVLEEELDASRFAIEKVKSDLARSRESYVRRERAYKTRIDELEDNLQRIKTDKTSWMTHDSSMTNLRTNIDSMHETIQENVDMVQERTTKILQEQERDLLRAFRARLFDVQTELDREKRSTDDGNAKEIEENKKLKKDLEWQRDGNDRLEKRNAVIIEENKKLKSKYSTQEKDRNYLIQALVEEKRKSARLSQDCEKAERENQRLQKIVAGYTSKSGGRGMGGTLDSFDFNSPGHHHGGRPGGARPGTTGGMGSLVDTGQDTKYKEIIRRHKRLLDNERSNLAKARERYVMEVRQRTEMEVLLRDAVEDVKTEIAKKSKGGRGGGIHGKMQASSAAMGGSDRKQSILGTAAGSGGVTVDDFTTDDRDRVMELLFAKERVINLLQSKAFPPMTKAASGQAPPPTKEEIALVYDGKEVKGGKGGMEGGAARPSTSSEAMGGGKGGLLPGFGGGGRPGTAGA
ncbi:hypothetical protein TeGR_g9353 [Tetraparma gracilis]|uniref:Cilia- and flagella-associated protein 157 n=1 Tax=Tetraparma gracilis TaxID=2962635 RepID=A0ABQ6MQ59_9STRA|nr:hypothetical protein TeGR_g9353 [Tetraparma gracilis]